MAVPGSGVLDWTSLAQECYYGTYGSGTITGIIGIKELVIGGQAGSGGLTYPAVNTDSPSHPNSSTPYGADEFYSYDKDAVALYHKYGTPTTVPKPVFACGVTTSADRYFTTVAVNEYVYTDAAGTTPLGAGNWGYGETAVASAGSRFTTNSSGYITVFTPCTPSDRRLKKNIKLIGYSPTGLKIYTFEYLDKVFGDGVFQGVMSDEIPSYAVMKNCVGEYDAVDYSKIDVDFKRLYFA